MSERGSSYVFVIIVVMIVISNLYLVIGISSFQTEITNAYDENLNNYEMAVSGIETTLNILNREISKNTYRINDNILKKIEKMTDNINLLYKLETNTNNYQGIFKIKDDLFNDIVSSEVRNVALDVLENVFTKRDEVYTYDYSVTSNVGENEYLITVIVKEITENGNKYFNVESLAENININASVVVLGKIDLKDLNLENKIHPKFEWNIQDIIFEYSIYTLGDIIWGNLRDENIINYGESTDIGKVNNLLETFWSENNNVLIIKKQGANFIDISNFYIENNQQETIIINDTNSELKIYPSDINKNKFNGVVYSKGAVTIDSIEFEGTLICDADVTVLESYDSTSFIENKDIIFKVNVAEKGLYYKILDYLDITKFSEITKKETEVYEVLENIKIKNKVLLEKQTINDVYIIRQLKKHYSK